MASFIAPRFGSQWAVGAASTVWNAESDFGKLSDGFLEEEVSPVSEGRLSLGRALGVLLGVALLVAPALADQRSAPTRVDLFDQRSNRTDRVELDERTGRIDIYDKSSRRTGSGTIDKIGRVDLFDLRGNRVGSGQVVPGTPRSNAGRR